MSNHNELTEIFLSKLEELVADHERHQKEQQQFFVKQQQQWEQKVTALTGQVQDLQRQLLVLSKSLPPLTAQLNSLKTLSDSLRNS